MMLQVLKKKINDHVLVEMLKHHDLTVDLTGSASAGNARKKYIKNLSF